MARRSVSQLPFRPKTMWQPEASDPILYRNEEDDVFLIDIPASIEAAQSFGFGHRRHLLSSEPLNEPYAGTEPKSAKAKAHVMDQMGTSWLEEMYSNLISLALPEIRHSGEDGDWCLPRCTSTLDYGQERSAESLQSQQDMTDGFLETLGTHEDDPFDFEQAHTPVRTWSILGPNGQDDASVHTETWDSAFQNANSRTVRLDVSLPPSSIRQAQSHAFLIPPKSTILLTSCRNTQMFRSTVRSFAADDVAPTPGSRRFDLMLLDPPWVNASAKRKRAYPLAPDRGMLNRLTIGLDLDLHLARGGFLAVWITNKQAVRDLVVGRRDGPAKSLFESTGVELVEEWIWVKTTVKGECVIDLESKWRKPYEVLLIGRRTDDSSMNGAGEGVKRRVIAAVPDLHSRKPCLKTLFEELLLGKKDYKALELFARYGVAGWWAWGDEAIKFNWEGYWMTL